MRVDKRSPKEGSTGSLTNDRRVVLAQNIDGSGIEVNVPLTSHVFLPKIMGELRVPEYVKTEAFSAERAIVTIWAARNVHKLHEMYPGTIRKRVAKNPINVLIFGGSGFKFHCPSANKNGGSFARDTRDLDLVVSKRDAGGFYDMLLCLKDILGSKYLHFQTTSDMMFNAKMRGKRYRIRSINDIEPTGDPIAGIMDIFCDEISLRHKLDVRSNLKHPETNLYTIGLENLILSKCQFIMDLPAKWIPKLSKTSQSYRILSHENYKPDMVILGMEEKDIRDVCAVFLDHPIGEGVENINLENFEAVLKRDKNLAKTLELNLKNVLGHPDLLKKFGATNSQISTIYSRIEAVLEFLPKFTKKFWFLKGWNKPWWNLDVETPDIFW